MLYGAVGIIRAAPYYIETLTRMGFENEDLLYFGYSMSDIEEFAKNNIDKTA